MTMNNYTDLSNIDGENNDVLQNNENIDESSKNLQSFKRSVYSAYFDVANILSNCIRVQCKQEDCGRSFTYKKLNGTRSLSRHLFMKHGYTISSKNTHINDLRKKSYCVFSDSCKISKHLIGYICSTFQSFSLIDDQSFTMLLQSLNNFYIPPKKTFIIKQIIEAKKEILFKISKTITSSKQTFPCSISKFELYGNFLYGITLHINDYFSKTIKDYFIGVVESSSNEVDICTSIHKKLQLLNIYLPNYIIRNDCLLLKDVCQNDFKIPNSICVVECLKLCLNDFFNLEPMNNFKILLAKLHNISIAIHKNSIIKLDLKEYSNAPLPKIVNLLDYSNIFYLIQSIIPNIDALRTISAKYKNICSFYLTLEEENVIYRLAKLLVHFKNIIEFFSTKTLSSSYIIPYLSELVENLESAQQTDLFCLSPSYLLSHENEEFFNNGFNIVDENFKLEYDEESTVAKFLCFKAIKNLLNTCLKKRISHFFQSSYHKKATFFNPLFSNASIFSETQMENIKTEILNELYEELSSPTNFSILERKRKYNTCYFSNVKDIETELDSFCHFMKQNPIDIFEFWDACNQQRFPNIFKFQDSFLSPASVEKLETSIFDNQQCFQNFKKPINLLIFENQLIIKKNYDLYINSF